MFCDKCGAEVNDSFKFCDKCGNDLKKDIPEIKNEPEISENEVKEIADLSDGIYKSSNTDIGVVQNTEDNNSSKKKKFNIILWIVACLLFVLLFSIIGINLFSNSGISKEISVKYLDILDENVEQINKYAEETGLKNVSLYDVNKNGREDLLYLTRSSSSGDDLECSLHILTSDGQECELDCSHFVIYKDEVDDSLYLYEKDKKTNKKIEEINSNGIVTDEKNSYFDKKQDNVVIVISDLADDEIDDIFEENDNVVSDIDNTKTFLSGISKQSTRDEATVKNEVINVEKKSDDKKEDTADKKEDSDNKGGTKKDSSNKKDIKTSDIPSSLKEFLQTFEYAYYNSQSDSIEYDCNSLKGYSSFFVESIVGVPSCVDLGKYPGVSEESSQKKNSDPKKKFSDKGYILIDKGKVIWIMKNIFNISESDAKSMIEDEIKSSNTLYEYEKDGRKSLCNVISDKSGTSYEIKYLKAKKSDSRYYIKYERYLSSKKDKTKLFVEVEEKKIDGKKYWSIYRHSINIPDYLKDKSNNKDDTKTSENSSKSSSPAKETTIKDNKLGDNIDVFSEFAGDYIFVSEGFCTTEIHIDSDGSFSGVYECQDSTYNSRDYSFGLYYNEFSGTFNNPQVLDSATCSFDLEKIKYKYVPNEQEITGEFTNGVPAYVVYSRAGVIDNDGSKTIYAYRKDAPLTDIPDEVVDELWAFGLTTNTDKARVRCLMTLKNRDVGVEQ